MVKKKGLNTKTITIFDLDNGYDFELLVTYEKIQIKRLRLGNGC